MLEVISSMLPAIDWQGKFFRPLERLGSLDSDWDGYGTSAPNRVAMDCARKIVERLLKINFPPQAIVPSAEGGVGITFRKDDRYAALEICNDGEIVVLTEIAEGEPTIWVEQATDLNLKKTLRSLRAFVEYNTEPSEDQWSPS